MVSLNIYSTTPVLMHIVACLPQPSPCLPFFKPCPNASTSPQSNLGFRRGLHSASRHPAFRGALPSRQLAALARTRYERVLRFRQRQKEAMERGRVTPVRGKWQQRSTQEAGAAARMHRCRANKSAAHNTKTFLILMLRKNIFSIRRMQDLPEVKRLQHLLHAGRKAKCSKKALMALMLLDAAARDPKFTAAMAHHLHRRRGSTEPDWKLLSRALRLRRRRTAPTYWTGRARSNLTKGVAQWTSHHFLSAAEAWMDASSTTRAKRLLDSARSLPHVGEYLAHCMVRQRAAALNISIRGGSESAATMRPHVKLLHDVVSFRTIRGALLNAGIEEARDWSWDMLSGFYCECSKILCDLKVLQDVTRYSIGDSSAITHLAGPAMERVNAQLREAKVLSDWANVEAGEVASVLGVAQPMRTLATVKRFRAACPHH